MTRPFSGGRKKFWGRSKYENEQSRLAKIPMRQRAHYGKPLLNMAADNTKEIAAREAEASTGGEEQAKYAAFLAEKKAKAAEIAAAAEAKRKRRNKRRKGDTSAGPASSRGQGYKGASAPSLGRSALRVGK